MHVVTGWKIMSIDQPKKKLPMKKIYHYFRYVCNLINTDEIQVTCIKSVIY